MDDQPRETTTETDYKIPARSPKGLQILQYAFQHGECVLEFGIGENGMTVMDVTDHHKILQEHYDQNANSNTTDNRTTGSS